MKLYKDDFKKLYDRSTDIVNSTFNQFYNIYNDEKSAAGRTIYELETIIHEQSLAYLDEDEMIKDFSLFTMEEPSITQPEQKFERLVVSLQICFIFAEKKLLDEFGYIYYSIAKIYKFNSISELVGKISKFTNNPNIISEVKKKAQVVGDYYSDNFGNYQEKMSV